MPDFESRFTPHSLSRVVESILDGHYDVIAERPRITTGSDRIELAHFLRDRDIHLAAISRKVTEGRYTFRPFLERQIPKPESKDLRTISIASIRDSVVQRALYDYLYPAVEKRLSPSVFGYRKGISAHNAVRLVRTCFTEGRVCVFDADLRKFFDTVDHDLLLGMVNPLEIDDRAKTLIRRFLKTGKIPSNQVAEDRASTGKQTKFTPEPRPLGVPQGGVLSGLLSNLYLSPFDTTILRHFGGYVRYADDFVVCCQSKEECRRLGELVRDELRALKVELNAEKTKECVPAATGVNFLGFHISTRGVRVRNRNVAKFKARIQAVLATQKAFKSPGRTLRSLIRRLMFKIRGPSEEQLQKLAMRGRSVPRCRRSWIGYFRIVDDRTQIRGLDAWLRRQVSAFIWRQHRTRVRLKDMQACGLTTLVNSLWKARGKKVPRSSEG
jgi:RNA-directed DNA polymerase